MPTTKNSPSESLAGNRIFANGIEQAQKVIQHRLASASPSGRREERISVAEQARLYAHRHPLVVVGTAMLAAYVVKRVFRPG
jgi:hypothetical protein